jgi:hypothetical protein
MLQKTNTPNPLNFFNVRRFKKKPKNLICQLLSLGQDSEEPIVNWIDQNLKSRFYFGRHLQLNSLGKFDYVYLVGFESPKEMSIFNLSCPYLHSR